MSIGVLIYSREICCRSFGTVHATSCQSIEERDFVDFEATAAPLRVGNFIVQQQVAPVLHDGHRGTAGCDALAPVEAFGTGCSALTWDDPCASLRELIREIDMAAAGAGSRKHSRDCQNSGHDTAVHGRIRVKPPLTTRKADGWCPNCAREGNKKLAVIDADCAKRLAGRPPRRAAVSFGDNDKRYTEVRDGAVQYLLAAAGGLDPDTGQAVNRSNLLQLVQGVLEDPILLQAIAVMVRFCIRSCRCMSLLLRGWLPTLKQLYRAGR